MTRSERPGPDDGEGRLLGYLEELREDPPASDAAIARRVRRSARWQQAARAPLQLVGQLAGAVAAGVSALLGAKPRSRP